MKNSKGIHLSPAQKTERLTRLTGLSVPALMNILFGYETSKQRPLYPTSILSVR